MRWGIIGPGNIAKDFAQDLQFVQSSKNTIAVALGDKYEHTAEFVKNIPGAAGAKTIEDFFEQKPECVYIATPHPLHVEYALKCLENKIPVLCEKPLAINAQQVNQLKETAERNKTFLMEGMWSRFLPSFNFLLTLITSGAIGEVISIRADMSFIAEKDKENRFYNPKLGGGSLLDVGVYTIYLSYFILGKPEKNYAAGKITKENIDETCGMMLTYSNGRYAMLESSIITRTENSAWIYGSEGTIRLKSPWTEQPDKIEVIINNESSFKHIPSWPGRGFQYEVEEVLQCLAENKTESTIIPLQASVDVVNIMDEVRKQLNIKYPDYE